MQVIASMSYCFHTVFYWRSGLCNTATAWSLRGALRWIHWIVWCSQGAAQCRSLTDFCYQWTQDVNFKQLAVLQKQRVGAREQHAPFPRTKKWNTSADCLPAQAHGYSSLYCCCCRDMASKLAHLFIVIRILQRECSELTLRSRVEAAGPDINDLMPPSCFRSGFSF